MIFIRISNAFAKIGYLGSSRKLALPEIFRVCHLLHIYIFFFSSYLFIQFHLYKSLNGCEYPRNITLELFGGYSETKEAALKQPRMTEVCRLTSHDHVKLVLPFDNSLDNLINPRMTRAVH